MSFQEIPSSSVQILKTRPQFQTAKLPLVMFQQCNQQKGQVNDNIFKPEIKVMDSFSSTMKIDLFPNHGKLNQQIRSL